jgi:RNA polymerase primary sigma factor
MKKTFINFNGDDALSKYFKDVRKTNLITPEREVTLSKRIKNGDDSAMDELINANLKFVISISKEYQGQGLSLSDLISEGNYGLIKAANKFDHTKGFRFISYAVWWIRQSILHSLSENSRTIRLPSNVVNKLSQLKKEIQKFEHENEREPVCGEVIGDELVMFTTPTCSSLNDKVSEDGSELYELIEDVNLIKDKNYYEVDDRVRSELERTLDILDDRERNIVECYFGINSGCEPMTLEDIGDRFNLTKERIRQIKERAIRRLRFNSSCLQDVLSS